jgi:hypothetical protein
VLRIARQLLRRSTYPVLLIPLQRGPLHGFYHFLIGYFIPALLFAVKNPRTPIAIVDSEPLNHWFNLFPSSLREPVERWRAIKIVKYSGIWGFSNGYRVKGFSGWDKWQTFRSREFRSVMDILNPYLRDRCKGTQTSSPEIIIMGRGFTPDYYAKHLPTRYGVAKRNIPNLEQVVAELEAQFSIELVDGATLSPEEMITKCSTAKIIVGQHGAALSNLLFLNPGSAVIEIGWPTILKDNQADIFRMLCKELGIFWTRPTLQQDKFSAISPSLLAKKIREVLELIAKSPAT